LDGRANDCLEALRATFADNERGRRAIGCPQTIRCQHFYVRKIAGHRPTQLIVVHGSDLCMALHEYRSMAMIDGSESKQREE